MGSIYKRGKIYWIKYYRNGQRFYESTESKKWADAANLLKEREGAKGKVPPSRKTSFENLKEIFLRDRRMEHGEESEKDAKKRLKNLEPFFGGRKATQIDTALVDAYVEKRLSEGKANATINREVRALGRMFSLGVEKELINKSDAPRIPTLKERDPKEGYFEDGDYHAILEELPEYMRGPVQFAYLTGWRKAQILGITWKMLYRKKRLITVPGEMTKNGKPHTIYLGDPLLEVINERVSKRRLDCPYVFHRDGNRIKDFRYVWNKACRKLGLGYGYRFSRKYAEEWEKKGLKAGPTIHDFRRTAVRNFNSAGIPEAIAMKFTSHLTNSTYKRYGIVSEEDLKWAAEKQAAKMAEAEKAVGEGS